MKINAIEIKNVKSFKERISLEFDNKFNILVGPNGGGKSNLLDIVTVILRHFFLYSYKVIISSDNMGYFEDIQQYSPFPQINNQLDKFIGDSSESQIIVNIEVENKDIENILLIKQNIESLKQALAHYRSPHWSSYLDEINQWDMSYLYPTQKVTYNILNNGILNLQPGLSEHIYYRFLNLFHLCLIAAKKAIELKLIPSNVKLSPRYVYFSPYRGVDQQNLQANLSGEDYYELLANYSGATSKNSTSLIKLSSLYFAEKRRNYENFAIYQGYQEQWNEDEEVKLVTKYLDKLGYSWDLQIRDANKNIYEISLKKYGKNFSLAQASSGEKEIINFLLGIFAFNLKNGLVIVDEPEVHLHPKWQSILIDLFFDLSNVTKNQFIISTHSAVFINQKTISNIVRIYKSGIASTIKTIDRINISSTKDLLHIINSHNNEKIFFADKVVLVEGITDRVFLEKLIGVYSTLFAETPEVIEVLEVYGKINLAKYRQFLQSISVTNFIVADQDYLENIGNEQIKSLFETDYPKIDQQVIKDKKSIDGQTIIQKIENAVETENLEELKNFLKYLKSRKKKLKSNLNSQEDKLIQEFIQDKKVDENIFILKNGEIEKYLPDGNKSLEKLIEFLKSESYLNFILTPGYREQRKELSEIIFSILGIQTLQDEQIVTSLRKYQLQNTEL
jgi:predicted ATP-dependent endonuclease of OLD family